MGGDRDHPSGAPCHRVRAYRASDRHEQDRGKRPSERSRAPSFPVCGQFLYHALRYDRLCADHDLRGEYRSHGNDKGIQRVCDRGSGSAVYHLFVHREDDNTDRYDAGSGDRRDLFPSLRNDRDLGHTYLSRLKGRLQPVKEHGNDFGHLCCRAFRHQCTVWEHPAQRNGAGMRGRHAYGTDVFCTG